MSPRRLVFFASEDSFFVSHFFGLACTAQNSGYSVSVFLRVRDTKLQHILEAAGIRVIDSAFERGRFGPVSVLRQLFRCVQVLRNERPDILHLISLRLVILGALASFLSPVPIRGQAVTGLGLLGVGNEPRARVVRTVLGWLMRSLLSGRRVAYLFENREDPISLGLNPEDPRILLVKGAGIDPERERVQPFPDGPTLKVALVARMIYSKGIEIAVRAVEQSRLAKTDVSLTLVGAPDLANPRSLTPEALEDLAKKPGVTWIGHSQNVQDVWRDHHVVCVPSLGGEGLPRSLLEGAAAGRPIVTTQTPGCAMFVRDGIEGFLVPPGDAGAIAEAFSALARDRALVHRMGAAARSRVLDGFTSDVVALSIVAFYERLSRSDRTVLEAPSSDLGEEANKVRKD